MKPALKIPSMGLLASVSSAVILFTLDLIGIINLENPFITVLEANGIQSTADYSVFAPWFHFWSALNFQMHAVQGIISGNFDLSIIVLPAVFLIITAGIGTMSSGRRQGFAVYVAYIFFNFLLSMIMAIILPLTLRVGALPPDEQDLVKGIGNNLVSLGILIPFVSNIIGFAITVVLGLLIVIVLSGKNIKKKKK